MMRQSIALFGGTLALLVATTGPGFAQTTPPSTAPPPAAAPAEKPSHLSMWHHVTGEVTAADQNAKTLTVRNSKGKEFTFTADSDTAGQLATLKSGDHVKVTYKKSHGQLVATKIAESRVAKAK